MFEQDLRSNGAARRVITVADATVEDVFPHEGGGLPRGIDFEVLRHDAMTVTAAEIAHTQFAPWYAKFLVALGRYDKRQQQRQQESIDARRSPSWRRRSIR